MMTFIVLSTLEEPSAGAIDLLHPPLRVASVSNLYLTELILSSVIELLTR